MISFHHWYARYIPDQQPLTDAPDPRIVSVTLQQTGDHQYADLIIDSGGALVAVPFIRLLPERNVFPASARIHGEAFLTKVNAVLTDWVRGKSSLVLPAAEIFTSDEPLRSILQDGINGVVPIAGASMHSELLSEADRYSVASRFLHGRKVLDLNPRAGYGLSTLKPRFDISGQWERGTPYEILGSRLGGEQTPRERFDAAIALSVDASDLENFLARMDSTVPSGRQIISTFLDGADALRQAGFEVQPLIRPALRTQIRDEWIGTRHVAPQRLRSAAQQECAPVEVCERPLRILFVLRSSANSGDGGGDVVQVNRTAEALRARGHGVDVSTDLRPAAAAYDIVHLTRLIGERDTLKQARAVAHFDGPVCLMPIFNDHAAETIWGLSATMLAFHHAPDEETLETNLDLLCRRQIQYRDHFDRMVLPPPARTEVFPGAFELEREIIASVDYLIANAYGEIQAIMQHVDCRVPFALVPTCADSQTYGPHARQQFVDYYGLQDFILMTGRLELRKNQLLLMHALRERPNLPIVMIGGSVVDDYPDLLRAFLTDNVTLLSHMPEGLLAGAYAAARVVALPSWDEVVSLSSLNAAASLASMVLSRNSFEFEYFGDDAQYCDPADVRSIRDAVGRAWNTHGERHDRRVALRERVIRDFSWERAARLTEEAYYRVRALNPRGDERRARAQR